MQAERWLVTDSIQECMNCSLQATAVKSSICKDVESQHEVQKSARSDSLMASLALVTATVRADCEVFKRVACAAPTL